jgi:hypothetical protein
MVRSISTVYEQSSSCSSSPLFLTALYHHTHNQPQTTSTQFDIKNHRHFLKRVKYDLSADALYPGATVTVFARQLAVRAFGDEATRRAVEARVERWVLGIHGALRATLSLLLAGRFSPLLTLTTHPHSSPPPNSTLALIKPNAFRYAGQILDALSSSGAGASRGGGGGGALRIANLRMARLDRREAEELYCVHRGAPFFDHVSWFVWKRGDACSRQLIVKSREVPGRKTACRPSE